MTQDGFTTCLWFGGQAEGAANHYISVFKDAELDVAALRNAHAGE